MKIASLLLALVITTGAEKSSEPVLLDFHTNWCGPCRQMRPVVQQLIQSGYKVKSIDGDESPDLVERYRVTAYPTFIVIDPKTGRSLARTQGAQPVGNLTSLYEEAKAKLPASVARSARDRDDDDADEAEKRPPRTRTNPEPWMTVVRIKIHGQGTIGFGSGTIIYSSPKEAIILTCAHIFKLDGRRQAHPSQFPNKIVIDLFDGQLRGNPTGQVHYANESYDGEAIDYDFNLDVGLIRIRPNRRLPYSRVVPASWQPQQRMKMTTVGCSEGHDATAWTTMILNPSVRGLTGNNAYEAIECRFAPKQGRSGGGLYTDDGYVAGVCDFAEPRGDHGLYATPRSIYRILDRNNLMALYAPVSSSGPLLAKNTATPPRQPTRTRAQSPDRDDANDVTIPPPEMLGITTPRLAQSAPRSETRKTGWHKGPIRTDDTKTTDLHLPPSADNDPFGPSTAKTETDDEESEEPAKPQPRKASKWRPVPSNSSGR